MKNWAIWENIVNITGVALDNLFASFTHGAETWQQSRTKKSTETCEILTTPKEADNNFDAPIPPTRLRCPEDDVAKIYVVFLV